MEVDGYGVLLMVINWVLSTVVDGYRWCGLVMCKLSHRWLLTKCKQWYYWVPKYLHESFCAVFFVSFRHTGYDTTARVLNMIPTRQQVRSWATLWSKCLVGRHSCRHLFLCSSPFCSLDKSLLLNLPPSTHCQVAWSIRVWSEPDAHPLLPLNLFLSTGVSRCGQRLMLTIFFLWICFCQLGVSGCVQ